MARFVIPLAFEDLNVPSSSNSYCVTKIRDVYSVSSQLKIVADKLSSKGPTEIHNNFDYFYSVLFHWHNVDASDKDKVLSLLITNCKQWAGKIVAINNDDQFEYRNCVQMVVYLIYKIFDLFENKIQSMNIVTKTCKGRKQKVQTLSGETIDYSQHIVASVNALSQLTKAPIEKLWTPSVVETEFVSLLSNCCYILMGNPEYCRNHSIRKVIAEILIKLNKFHNHTKDGSIQLCHLLQSHQHFVNTLLYLCSTFLEHNLNFAVRELLREICSYSGADLEKNSQASSNFANFLSEFGVQYPHEIAVLLPVLFDKLEEEPYCMRNAVLTILGEVFIKVYKNDAANRESIFDAIKQHFWEINSFVRSKSLAVLLHIAESNHGFALHHKNQLMKLLVGESGAIFDTSANARKFAIKILNCFIHQNMAKGLTDADLIIDLKVAKENYEESKKKYDEFCNTTEEEFFKKKIGEIENDAMDVDEAFKSAVESYEGKKKEFQNDCEVKKGIMVIMQQSAEYTQLLNQAVGDMAYMLNSKTTSDVLAAIAFFTDAKLNEMDNIDIGLRKMLLLIFSKDKVINSAVAESYKKIYFSKDNDNIEHSPHDIKADNEAIKTVNQLCSLIHDSSYGELMSLEMLIKHFADNGEITENVVNCMWKRCMSKQNNDMNNMRMKRYAAVLFSMVTQNNLPFMFNYLSYFVRQELSFEWLKSLDFYHVAYLCQAIQNLAKLENKPKEEPFRLPSDHSLFTNLSNLCVETMTVKNKPNWIFMGQEIINIIYQLSENPNSIISHIIHKLAINTFQVNKTRNDKNVDPMSQDVPHATVKQSNNNNSVAVNYDLLTRFMSVAGHSVLKQFTHFEVSIISELKRRNQVQKATTTRVISKCLSKDDNENKYKQSRSNASIASNVPKKSGGQSINADNLEQEMGLEGATADDTEADFMRHICDKELVTNPAHLFHYIVELAVWICSKGPASKSYIQSAAVNTGVRNPQLQTQAVLALSKAMLASEPLCLKHVELLFSVAECSPSNSLRANLLAAFGDLVCRFPHVLEPYTKRLYARLRDEAVCVRTSALNVISHLILHDLVKVKGQISDITKCLVDFDTRIVHLSKVFFQELSNRDKALYNVMPDIISNLSDPENGVNEENFRVIMGFLMPFIQKKILNENLFAKICARFDPAGPPLTWINLAHCLSLLQYNENMIESLQYKLNIFAPMLYLPEVYDSLSSVVERARKTIRQEKQEIVEEISYKLKEMQLKGIDDEKIKLNAEKVNKRKKFKNPKRLEKGNAKKSINASTPMRATQTKSKDTAQPTDPKTVRSIFSSSSEDSDDQVASIQVAAIPIRKLRSSVMDDSAKSLRIKRMTVADSSDEDD